MNPDKVFIQNIILLLIIIGASGCSKGGLDSTQTPASPLPLTEISQSKNNTFDYYVDTPNGWRVLKNDKTHLNLAGPVSNNERYFVNPDLSIFIPDSQKYPKEGFIKNALKGTTSNIELVDIPKATKFNVVAYECTQNSAHTEYLVYYAFITTNDDFVVMFLSGDMSIKEDLKSVFYNFLKTFKKI